MQQNLTKYLISFGKNKEEIIEGDQRIIPENNLEILINFEYNDYYSNSTVGSLKEYFLTTFGSKYGFCKCELSLYYKENDEYVIFSNSDETLLRGFRFDRLYLIRDKIRCNCEYKDYVGYFNIEKFNLIEKLKILDDEFKKLQRSCEEKNLKNEELQKEIGILKEKEKQIEEIKNENLKLKKTIDNLNKIDEIIEKKNKKFEDFYDIIININSIRNVNKEGWKVKFTKNGLEKYKRYKNKELITLGVLGNNNKGKSFLLSKISKINLLTGTSIQTEGLSVKYPD